MIKAQELANPKSCLNRAAEDEPVFVLRAQDQHAPDVILKWCDMYRRHHAPGGLWRSEDHRLKHNEAIEIIDQFERWHARKVPD